MHKRSVRLKDKENQQEPQQHQNFDNNNNNHSSIHKTQAAKDHHRTFYVIVEEAKSSSAEDSRRSGRSQYWLINSNSIVDVPEVNNDTVYTGKQLRFKGAEANAVYSGTCVLFSPDFAFVQSQFRQITSTMDADKATMPTVLNNSTKGNILGHSGKRSNSNVKIPSSVSIKTIGKPSANRKDDPGMIEIPLLGDPDVENRPPTGKSVSVNGGGGGKMTFDQQSQTDDIKMFDSVVPATAQQMHQQSNQLAQLIRANNALAQEVRDMKESKEAMQQTMTEMSEKLSQTLAWLMTRPNKAEPEYNNHQQQPQSHPHFVDVQEPEVDPMESKHPSYEHVETSMDGHSSSMTMNAPSREQSVARSTTSEYTPPLKKNKAKLRMSQQSLLGMTDEADLVALGPNGTMVSKAILCGLSNANFSTVTRKILSAVFDRETLASHSLTGKPSPAFLERGAKNQLDSTKISDIVSYVSAQCGVTETAIRGVITCKCADENKMIRLQAKKRASMDSGCDLSTKRRQTTFN